MSSLNTETNENQKPTEVHPISKLENTPSGDTIRDSKSVMKKKMKITESGDGDTASNVSNSSVDEPVWENVIEESSLASTSGDLTIGGTVTNSSLDESLADPNWDGLIGDSNWDDAISDSLLDESFANMSLDETLTKYILDDGFRDTSFDDSPGLDETLDAILKEIDANMQTPKIKAVAAEVPYKDVSMRNKQPDSENWKTSSFLPKERSCSNDPVVENPDVVNKINDLNITSAKAISELPDEKHRSHENINKILANEADEFGPDIATTNLLLMASRILDTHTDVEFIYTEQEKRARKIVRRRFHLTLEEFFETIATTKVTKREGLDRFERFLDDVNNAALKREKAAQIEKNYKRFNKLQMLKNIRYPFQSTNDKHEYFRTATLTAIYVHTRRAIRIVNCRRGYVSV